MCGTDVRTELPLASAEPSGCSCCSPESRTQTRAPAPVGGFEYLVEGLTCGHCVQTVEKAASGVTGVKSATVELVVGGRSRLTVTGEVAGTAVQNAVSDAGYSVTAAK